MHVHHAQRHVCMCFHANMTVAYCRQLSNTSIFKVWKKNIKDWKSYSSFNWFNSCASRAPTCMHFHEKWHRFRTSTQHSYSYLKGFNFIYWVVLWEHLQTKKLREESRKKWIIIRRRRNRVKTICFQTSFGEHKNPDSLLLCWFKRFWFISNTQYCLITNEYWLYKICKPLV